MAQVLEHLLCKCEALSSNPTVVVVVAVVTYNICYAHFLIMELLFYLISLKTGVVKLLEYEHSLQH
jgi:hypothetical protein